MRASFLPVPRSIYIPPIAFSVLIWALGVPRPCLRLRLTRHRRAVKSAAASVTGPPERRWPPGRHRSTDRGPMQARAEADTALPQNSHLCDQEQVGGGVCAAKAVARLAVLASHGAPRARAQS